MGLTLHPGGHNHSHGSGSSHSDSDSSLAEVDDEKVGLTTSSRSRSDTYGSLNGRLGVKYTCFIV